MKIVTLLKITLVLVATSCFNQYYLNQVNCEQLSTVFVLETSDSQPKSGVNNAVESSWPSSSSSSSASSSPSYTSAKEQRSVSEDINTKIITDETQPQQTIANVNRQKIQDPLNSRNTQENSRRVQLEEQERLTRNSGLRNNNQQSIQQPINQPIRRSSSTTTTTTQSPPQSVSRDYQPPSSSSSEQGNGVPKEENRLLISIQSDNDDYKPIIKQPSDSSSISISSNDNENKQTKPIITLSFQDANKHKGTVIVRPSENGQSIVISTVGGNNNPNNHQLVSNNYQSGGYNNNNNNGQQPPYREPVETNPYQPLSSSTTYKPSVISSIGSEYTSRPVNNNNNNNNNYNNINRPPLVSTLVDNPTRPNDDLPSRPTNLGNINGNNGYNEPISPPSSRPIRPTQDVLLPSSSSSSGYSNLGPNRDPDSSIQTPASQYDSKYPLNEKNCGLMEGTRIVGGEEVNHDEYLWMAAMVKAKSASNGEARPFCGGSLITRRHILTAAHCLENLTPRDILVRLGSYDFDDATSSSTSGDYAIDQFRVPANYSKKTHISDIALLRLKTPLSTNDNYKTVCMPQARRSYVGTLGTVIGYGSQNQQFRRAAPKLRQVTVPIWENRKCGVVYKKNLTDSFLCAGFEEGGKDACQGDSGGPLMAVGPNERMMVVGVVSHGIGCGSPEYPGVYTRVTSFAEWIEKNTRD